MIALLSLSPLVLPIAPLVQDQNRITPVVEVVRQARPSVVSITSNLPAAQARSVFDQMFRRPSGVSSGSGVVIFEDGYIVTNYHVVRDASHITVRFDEADDANEYEATLISYVETEDLALIKINGSSPFPTVPLSSSDPILGETVIAIGNSYGQTHTVSTGIVSGLHRDIQAGGGPSGNLSFTNLIQTDASINPGNSGGPLLNINGDMVGLNTAMNVSAENIGFAIPVDRIKRVLEEELLSPARARSFLGYELAPDGSRVEEVLEGGPAGLAGLRPGDRLVSINGRSVSDPETYRLARVAIQPNEEVELTVRRDDEQRTLSVTAWNRLDGYLFERAGMTVEPVHLGRGRWNTKYISVATIQEDGPAWELGLRSGDVIAAIRPPGWRARRLETGRDLALLLTRLEPGTTFEVELWRDEDDDGYFEQDEEYSELYKGTLTLR